jgi:VanZ family protein
MLNLLRYKYAMLWAGFILFATIANTGTLEQLSLDSLFAFDKPIHLILFAVQTHLIIIAQASPVKQQIRIAAAIAGVYGILTEVMQGWLTLSRTFDYFDMLADFIGCLLLYIWHMRKLKKV